MTSKSLQVPGGRDVEWELDGDDVWVSSKIKPSFLAERSAKPYKWPKGHWRFSKVPDCDSCVERKVKCDARETQDCTRCVRNGTRCRFSGELARLMFTVAEVLTKDENRLLRSMLEEKARSFEESEDETEPIYQKLKDDSQNLSETEQKPQLEIDSPTAIAQTQAAFDTSEQNATDGLALEGPFELLKSWPYRVLQVEEPIYSFAAEVTPSHLRGSLVTDTYNGAFMYVLCALIYLMISVIDVSLDIPGDVETFSEALERHYGVIATVDQAGRPDFHHIVRHPAFLRITVAFRWPIIENMIAICLLLLGALVLYIVQGRAQMMLDLAESLFATMLGSLRARMRHGHRRLTWSCTCGRKMYGDYLLREVLEGSHLTRSLPHCQMLGTPAQSGTTLDASITTECSRRSLRKLVRLYWARFKVASSQFLGYPFDSPRFLMHPIERTCDVASGEGNLGNRSNQSNTRRRASDNTTLAGSVDSGFLKPTPELNVADSGPHQTLSSDVPAYLELCVNTGRTRVSLGEIRLNDGRGNSCIKTDMQLFKKIHGQYQELRRKGIYRLLYRPTDIQFVLFGVQRAGYLTGIYQKPLSIPPTVEVKEQRYHYYECPLDPLPPIDKNTFFHYFWEHASHPVSSGHPGFDSLFLNRMPKKLGDSVYKQCDPTKLQKGWGVHIIEGPNKPLLAWLATAILVLSFLISLTYDIVAQNKESGFAIGQWMVAVLATALTAMYFHLADIA